MDNLSDPPQGSSYLNQSDNDFVAGGQDYWVQNAARVWSLTSPSTAVARFEVRSGDVWTYDNASRERSEIAGVTNYANGTEIDLHYGFKLEPGATNTAAWTVVGQLHQDSAVGGSPPFAFYLVGEQMAVQVGFTNAQGSQVQETVYLDPTPIQRGHVYDIKVAVTFDPKGNGALVVWRDGVEIVDYRGALGYVGETSTYFKEGIYRAAAAETLAADYSNLSATTTAGLTQTGAPIAPQLTLAQLLTNDTGASGSDLVSNQGAVGLSGVATSTSTVTVRDGAAVLGAVPADSTGHWVWWGTLNEGSHALTASAVSTSGVTATTAAAPTIVIDRTAPIAPIVSGVVDLSVGGAPTLTTTAHKLDFTGTAEAGAVVKLFMNGSTLGTTTADASGHWAYDATATPIANGKYNLMATAADAAGNTSSGSSNKLLTVDDSSLPKIPPSAPKHAAPGDVDGDGKSDVLWRNSTTGETGAWLSSHGTGVASYVALGKVETAWSIVGSADFDGDGKTDLLWRNANGEMGAWLSTRGGGGSSYVSYSKVGPDWQVAGTGDFDGDGKADVMFRSAKGQIGVWESTHGTGSASYQDLGVVGTDWTIVGTGDCDGDGKNDIIWRNSSGQVTEWLSTQGTGGSSAMSLGLVNNDLKIVGVGDLDGDGKADVVFRSSANGHVGEWLSTKGAGSSSYTDLGYVAPLYQVAGVADYDGDGKADILFRNTSTGEIGAWESSHGVGLASYVSFGTNSLDWASFPTHG